MVLGFAIPFLLVRHVVTTRISDNFFHTDVGYYAYLLWVYFVRSPEHGVVQMLVLVVAWGHAMIGLHFWLRVRPWYARLQPAALVVAVLIPALSLLGAIEAGRQVTALAADPNWIHERITLPSPETQSILETITELLTWFFAGMVGAVLLARLARRIWQRRHGLVRIGYPDGRTVEVTPGTSVLATPPSNPHRRQTARPSPRGFLPGGLSDAAPVRLDRSRRPASETLHRRRHSRPMSRAVAAGRTRTFGGLDDIFQLERARRLHGRRSARSYDRKIMVWKTQALCATVGPR